MQQATLIQKKHSTAQCVLQTENVASCFEQATQFSIAELGFGFGQAFFEIAAAWLSHSASDAVLTYYAFESELVSYADWQQGRPAEPEGMAALIEDYAQAYPLRLPGWQTLRLAEGRVVLKVYIGEALMGLTDLEILVDAWLISPRLTADIPDLTPALLTQLRRQSHLDTSLTCLIEPKDPENWHQLFAEAGFRISKDSPLETLTYAKVEGERKFSSKTPWFSRPAPIKTTSRPGKLIVVGAGLAGAATAYELAEAGWSVQVLDAGEQAASGASGNLAGALHPLVTADWNLRSQWYWQGLQASLARLKPWCESGEVVGALNGLMHLATDDKHYQRMQDALSRVGLPPEFAQWLKPEQAANKVGGHCLQPGLFFHQAGWFHPPSIIARCLAHPNINVSYQQKVLKLDAIADKQAWLLSTQTQNWQADAVVLATGALSDLNARYDLPIRPVKGQVSYLNPDQQAWRLDCAVAHQGYSAPADAGQAVTGATFEAPSLDPSLSQQAHQQNLESVSASLPDWLSADCAVTPLSGRVSFRPTSPDHLPIVGAVVDPNWMQKAYLNQSHTQSPFRYPPQQYQPGLYVNNGHGARGLMSVFLAAKILRADLMGETLPVAPSIYAASHPARFAIRQWRRQGSTVG